MPALVIEISRFVDEYQPGIVECVLVDALGQTHIFVEKAPVVSKEDLLSTSVYPRPGAIECEIEEEWEEGKRSLVRVNTGRPWGIESSAGEMCFVVSSSQVRR